jgi:hypothetical protein
MIAYVPNYDLWRYRQVFKITERKDGAIFKTEDTKLSINASEAHKLPPGYVAVDFNIDLDQPDLSISLVSPEYFK